MSELLDEWEHTNGEEQVTVEGAREKRSGGGPEKDGEAKRKRKTTEEHVYSDEDIKTH